MLFSLVIGSLAAYSLARFRLRYGVERHIGVGLLTLRILPPIVIIVPAFLLVERLHLLNTWVGLIVIYTAFNVSFVVWMMESFFREIPVDLEEAAMMDGDSRLTAFRRIVLPLARPGLVATAIFAVIVTYNEFLFALVLTSTPSSETMPVGAATLIGRINVDWGAMSAAGHRRRAADHRVRPARAAPPRARADDGGRQVASPSRPVARQHAVEVGRRGHAAVRQQRELRDLADALPAEAGVEPLGVAPGHGVEDERASARTRRRAPRRRA